MATARRVVIKVGSAQLIDPDSLAPRQDRFQALADDINALRSEGREVVLVSSAAVALGRPRLGLKPGKTLTLEEKQAAAAAGQALLIQHWDQAFARHGFPAAQALVSPADIESRPRWLNAHTTLETLLKLGAVPVINENDTVVTDEIRFGDNDTLGALVANLLEADALLLLTDQEGLYDADPRHDPAASLIEEAQADDPILVKVAGGGGVLGRGGMATKVRAARLAARSGALTVIASGRQPEVITRLASGERFGTLLLPEHAPIAARKRWIAGQLQVRGTLTLDAGAVNVLTTRGSSLLPVGVRKIEGAFKRGDLVQCVDESGQRIAKGLVNYSAEDAGRILGLPSHQIEATLGYIEAPELIHRDNLIVL
ncbi:MAG TPA: glutamate 5-kinase [Oceanicaulis sp.]|nr:glutamate 5-kinase [Oceanicaulis sp.]